MRSIISRNARRRDARDFDIHALRDEEDGECRRNFNSCALNNAYQNPSSRAPSLSNGERRFVQSSLSLSLFLLFFLRPTIHRLPLLPSLSAVFITHRRHGARLHYTHIHSTSWPRWKNLASGLLSSADTTSPCPSRISRPWRLLPFPFPPISFFFPHLLSLFSVPLLDPSLSLSLARFLLSLVSSFRKFTFVG